MTSGDTMESNGQLMSGASSVEDVSEAYDEAAEARPVSRLVFPLAGHGLLYDQRVAMEYFEGQALFRIPNRHPLFHGLINRRGSLVPIFDIRQLIDPQADTQRRSKLLVLGQGDDAVGIILDDTPYRVSLNAEQESSPPGHLGDLFGPHLSECFEQNDRCLMSVSLGDFLYDMVHETT